MAERLGLSVTVRVRVRARAREWNPFLPFFFLLCKCGGHHLLCSPGAWPALSMSHVSMTSSGMKRGEQSGSRKKTCPPAPLCARSLVYSRFQTNDRGLRSGNETSCAHAYKIRKWRPSQRTAASECCEWLLLTRVNLKL